MKKLLFALAVSQLLIGCSKDEVSVFGNIYGTIRDAETGDPIYNAEIMLSPGNRTTISGRDGSFEYQNLDAGQYSLSINAAGYQYNSRTVSIVAGESVLCDMHLNPETPVSGMEISVTSLNFDTAYNELTFDIRNTGTSGALSWTITGVDAEWLTINPMSGTTNMGKSSSVKVTVNRSLIAEDSSTIFTVNAAGGSKSVMVSVRAVSGNGDSGNGGDGGGDGDDVSGTTDDYSSANVTQCDSRIVAKIVDCKRTGTSVVFNFTLTNTEWETIGEFRIVPPASLSATPQGYKTTIFDDLGNDYQYPAIYIGDKYTKSSNIVENSLPKDVPRKCSITITAVP